MTLLMYHVDPALNAYRFYALSLERTLFGDIALVRQWGRLGTSGRQVIELHPNVRSARQALRRYEMVRRRHGYYSVKAGQDWNGSD